MASRRGSTRTPALGLVGGLVADWLVGDPRRGHPVAGFGSVAAALERRMWRPSRAAGALYVVALVGGATGTTVWIDRRLRRWPPGRLFLLGGLTWAAVGGRQLARAGRELGGAVRGGDLGRARELAPTLVGRDPRMLDGPELCRAAVESVAENTADAVIGPLLWGALAGPAGVVGYRAANTLDAMVGHKSPRYLRFGWVAARLDDLLGWPAARLGAGLACLLAPAVGGDAQAAWRTLRHDGAAHPSPNAGRMEAAFAGALGVRLGGRNNYGDRAEDRPVLGDGPLPTPDDVDRAVRLSLLIGAATAAVIALARPSNAGRPRVRRAAQHATMMAGAAYRQDQEQRG